MYTYPYISAFTLKKNPTHPLYYSNLPTSLAHLGELTMPIHLKPAYSFKCCVLFCNLNVPHLTLPQLTFIFLSVFPIINNPAINIPV